jgi:hypothetical protein
MKPPIDPFPLSIYTKITQPMVAKVEEAKLMYREGTKWVSGYSDITAFFHA